MRHTHHPLVPFARVQSMSRVDVFVDHRDPVRREPAIATNDPSMGFCFPSASPADSSDLHRVCLTRLCSTFRFSQPLGALLRPQPVQPCFVPVTLLGFPRLQRFPPAGSWSSSHDETCPSCRFYARRSRRHRGGAIADASAAPGMRAPGGSVVAGRCYPVIRARSSPDVPSSRS